MNEDEINKNFYHMDYADLDFCDDDSPKISVLK